MTGAAGFTLRHAFHGCLVGTLLGLEYIRMTTVAAAQGLNVDGVREGDVADIAGFENDIPGMASGTVGLNRKGPLAVMTGAAGFTLLHYFHADMVAVILLFEYFRVALLAISAMDIMAEYNFSDCLGLYGDFFNNSSHSSHAAHADGEQSGRQGN